MEARNPGDFDDPTPAELWASTKEQVGFLVGMITRPLATMRALPSDRFLILSCAVLVGTGMTRVARDGRWSELATSLGPVGIAIALAVGIGVSFAFAAGTSLVMRLFHRRVSVQKSFNLLGYTNVPRLAIGLYDWMALAILPDSDFVRLQNAGMELLASLYGLVLLGIGLAAKDEGGAPSHP